jgi:lysophospholipase L1-like esterase
MKHPSASAHFLGPTFLAMVRDRKGRGFRVAMAMKREHVFWLLMAVCSVAVVAAGIEIFVRVFVDDGMQFDLEMWKYARDVKQAARDPLGGHAHRPNSAARLMGVDVTINSKGLRDREIPYERSPSTVRILMLGDSFTEGWGVPFEHTFSKRIERLYADRAVKAEVINAGVGNYDTIMEVSYFVREGYKYRPDVVVLNHTFNDAEAVPAYSRPNWLLRHCYSCVFVVGRLDALARDASLRPDWKDYYLGLYGGGRSAGWLAAKAAMKTLADEARARRIKLLVATLPELHELKDYPLQGITDLVRAAAEENGAEFIDLLPALANNDPASLWVSPTDPHPNTHANEVIANALFGKLTTMERESRTSIHE